MYQIQMPGGRLSLNWEPQDFSIPASNEVYADSFTDGSSGDQTAAFQAALDLVASRGAGIVRYVGSYDIDGDVIIPEGVALIGPISAAGQLRHLGLGAADYERKPGVLRVASTATIRVGASGHFCNFVSVRKGLDLPFSGVSAALAGIAAFSGTAVTMAGNDARVSNALFLGFNHAIDSHNYARLRFTDVQGDCLNGIRISGCTDVPYMTRCHFWPFTTANYTWTASDLTQAILVRPGIGIELKNTVDWAKLTNCFTFGYFRGFRLADVQANLLTGCASDSPVKDGLPVVPGSIGVLVEGNALDNKLTDFTAAGQAQGLFFGANEGTFTEAIGCNNVACDIGINVRGGDVQIIGGMDRVARVGLQVQSVLSKVTVMRKMRQVQTTMNVAAPGNINIVGTLT